ncbi:MAG: metal-dependent transcriptional regulator [Tenericutes bacterium]|jgi:DtxR family Mn-dependent transcriptional regulator|nr:metal-dependent transcriptional regulator [Mycoplasmatota bacterium]
MKTKRYSESLENYLETIYMFGGKDVKSIDLANHLKVSRASVNNAINSLIEKILVTKALYGNITLTEEGIEVSKKILDKHELLKVFLIEVLEVNPKQAEDEACGIEHVISDFTANQIKKLMKQLKNGSQT